MGPASKLLITATKAQGTKNQFKSTKLPNKRPANLRILSCDNRIQHDNSTTNPSWYSYSAAISTNISVTSEIQTMPEGSFKIEDFEVRSRGT